ncbi:hypothetical protein C4561_01340 [candidate division WWE3 bacterium]|uniref:Uncharacterized protein n=1 Tax=candidate division WWE3 bacterium TaxID=2053526 RepID=A0A3A4ZMG7_UNCKA|nr:MAG: hypothetical protein C4561_01340 [candidate division WWE3 bacterium]
MSYRIIKPTRTVDFEVEEKIEEKYTSMYRRVLSLLPASKFSFENKKDWLTNLFKVKFQGLIVDWRKDVSKHTGYTMVFMTVNGIIVAEVGFSYESPFRLFNQEAPWDYFEGGSGAITQPEFSKAFSDIEAQYRLKFAEPGRMESAIALRDTLSVNDIFELLEWYGYDGMFPTVEKMRELVSSKNIRIPLQTFKEFFRIVRILENRSKRND